LSRLYVTRRQSLEMVCKLDLREEDFTDDRLSLVLKYLSEETKWQEIEKELNKNTIRIYQLPVERIRLDATTVNGHHLVVATHNHNRIRPQSSPF
jgi:transposase